MSKISFLERINLKCHITLRHNKAKHFNAVSQHIANFWMHMLSIDIQGNYFLVFTLFIFHILTFKRIKKR